MEKDISERRDELGMDGRAFPKLVALKTGSRDRGWGGQVEVCTDGMHGHSHGGPSGDFL